MLSFVPCCMKDNVKVIYFHMKNRGADGLVSVHLTFETCITNFHFENSEVGIKATIANL